jgi:DNA-binding response OmpR family regulator
MSTVNRTLNAVLAPRVTPTADDGRSAPPRLLRCLVVSATAARRRLIRAAAEREAWDAIVCRDAGEFLRAAFKRSVPLMIVDLPREDSPGYWALRNAADRAKQISDALVAVAGAGATEGEELWARKLGAWSYLSETYSQRGFEFVFSEARAALTRTDQAAGGALVPAPTEDSWHSPDG